MTRENMIRDTFNKLGTDKFNHCYAQVYANVPQNISNMIEIGCNRGSLLSFVSIFPDATIYGIDCDGPEVGHSRVRVIESDIKDLDVSGLPIMDLIVDDGSHQINDIMSGFKKLFPKLSGCYFIEDVSDDMESKLLPELANNCVEICHCLSRDDSADSTIVVIRK